MCEEREGVRERREDELSENGEVKDKDGEGVGDRREGVMREREEKNENLIQVKTKLQKDAVFEGYRNQDRDRNSKILNQLHNKLPNYTRSGTLLLFGVDANAADRPLCSPRSYHVGHWISESRVKTQWDLKGDKIISKASSGRKWPDIAGPVLSHLTGRITLVPQKHATCGQTDIWLFQTRQLYGRIPRDLSLQLSRSKLSLVSTNINSVKLSKRVTRVCQNLKLRIYKTVILPVVHYGCETWTLTLREEHRLRVFENKVLRIIFGAKRDEVTGEWRKLHNTELHALYSSPDIIRNIKSRRLRWLGHVASMGESRNAYRVLVGRPEGKRPLGRPRRRWEDNIKIDLREVGCDGREWINLAQDRDQWRAYVRGQ
ncbi:hypothetical protein ANN_11569 [Periplaneta americana]|uniref:Endonuclease-reverse transcriptase n=1 Tax=Periplaneta americana TaxID=6978 RepID=A0ABQ8T6I3_PERAM|nr:hypothetical protein ANN_11569 [Periplaneta americana]